MMSLGFFLLVSVRLGGDVNLLVRLRRRERPVERVDAAPQLPIARVQAWGEMIQRDKEIDFKGEIEI